MSTPERERRLISHRLARSLGVWGGARGVGREGGKEEVDDIYGDSTFPPPPYNYTTPVTPPLSLLLLIAHHHAVTAPTARAQSAVGSLPVSEG